MAKRSMYSDVNSLALKKGEETFPFMAYKVARDWDEIYTVWCNILRYCRNRGIVVGRHGEKEEEDY